MRCLHRFKLRLHRILINCQGESSNFTAKRPGSHHHSWVNALSDWTIEIVTYLVRWNKKAHYFCDIPARDAEPDSNPEQIIR